MLSADRIGGALVLVKAADVAIRGPEALPAPVWGAVLALWIAGGAGLLRGRLRPGAARACWGAVLCAGAGLALDYPLELSRQHLVLLMAVALGALVAREDRERLLLWRAQLTALYGVAALAKVNESFLGGDVLARGVVAAPMWSALFPTPPLALLLLAGLALIALEALLAVTPWVRRLRRPGTAVAAGLHVGALVLATTSPLVALRLVVFGGTAVLLHAASAGLVLPGGAPATAGSRPARRPGGAGRGRGSRSVRDADPRSAPSAGREPAPWLPAGPRRRPRTSPLHRGS